MTQRLHLFISGRFGADMDVEIHNDGPLTIMLEREFSGA